jgi:hypothetical protein
MSCCCTPPVPEPRGGPITVIGRAQRRGGRVEKTASMPPFEEFVLRGAHRRARPPRYSAPGPQRALAVLERAAAPSRPSLTAKKGVPAPRPGLALPQEDLNTQNCRARWRWPPTAT